MRRVYGQRHGQHHAMGAVQALAGPPHLQPKIVVLLLFLLALTQLLHDFGEVPDLFREVRQLGRDVAGIERGSRVRSDHQLRPGGRLQTVVQDVHGIGQYFNAVHERHDGLFEHIHRAGVRTCFRHDVDQEHVHLLPGVHGLTLVPLRVCSATVGAHSSSATAHARDGHSGGDVAVIASRASMSLYLGDRHGSASEDMVDPDDRRQDR